MADILVVSPRPSGHTAGLHFPASLATRYGHVTVLPNQMHVEVTSAMYSLTYCPRFYLSGIKMALGQTQPYHGSPSDRRQLPKTAALPLVPVHRARSQPLLCSGHHTLLGLLAVRVRL